MILQIFLPAVKLLSSVITQVPLYRGDRAAVYFGPQTVYISGSASEEPRGIFWLTAQNRTFAQKKLLQIGAAPYAKQGALQLANKMAACIVQVGASPLRSQTAASGVFLYFALC